VIVEPVVLRGAVEYSRTVAQALTVEVSGKRGTDLTADCETIGGQRVLGEQKDRVGGQLFVAEGCFELSGANRGKFVVAPLDIGVRGVGAIARVVLQIAIAELSLKLPGEVLEERS